MLYLPGHSTNDLHHHLVDLRAVFLVQGNKTADRAVTSVAAAENIGVGE